MHRVRAIDYFTNNLDQFTRGFCKMIQTVMKSAIYPDEISGVQLVLALKIRDSQTCNKFLIFASEERILSNVRYL